MTDTDTETRNAAYAALVLRTALGVMFIAHGLLKVFVFTPAGTAGFFASLGLPEFLAYVTIAAEIAGGILMIAGIFVRWIALALMPVLLGAIFLVHGNKGWLFSNEGGGWEYPAFLMVTSLVLVLLGNGAHALKLPGIGEARSSTSH